MAKLFIVTVIDGDKAVYLYQTLYAVPEPHVGAGVALAAFFKSPEAKLEPDEHVISGVSVAAVTQLACAKTIAGKLRKRKAVIKARR